MKNKISIERGDPKNAISWAVAKIDAKEIDEINILNAAIKAMHQSLAQLKILLHILLLMETGSNPMVPSHIRPSSKEMENLLPLQRQVSSQKRTEMIVC